MPGEPKVGVSVAQPPSSSGVATTGWAVLAIAAQVALVDAAIETFRGGSPLRWWVAPPVLLFVALNVWLWRPGGWAAKRWRWQGAASWSIGGLLLLLAVTAWLPEGQTNGVRMLLQPTATVLTLVTAAAMILAAFVLIRALTVVPATARLVARAVLIALAAYALVSLGLALYERAPFASLFQGGASWQRLPRWLQGSFIGALVLLPLAILGQVVRVIDYLRRRESVWLLGHQITALVMAFVMAVSGMTLPGSPLQIQRQTPTEATPAVAVAQDTLPGKPVDDGAREFEESRDALLALLAGAPPGSSVTPEQASERLADMFSRLEGALPALSRTSFDVDAVRSAVGSEPEALFEWVRDQTWWVPYRGTLRGATGVLMDRLGNSLDSCPAPLRAAHEGRQADHAGPRHAATRAGG